MIVPRGMFGQLSNPTTAAPESVRPQMVPFGGLQQAALEKVWQEGNISEAIRLEKEGKFADGELQGACKLMESTKNIAMLIHREESSPEGKTLPTREGVLALMKIVCPVLKLTYPFVTRCIKCAVLENMIKRWYDPKYEGKVYPGDASAQKCNEPGWPTKNFAISAALLSNANLFASNMCANTTLAGDKQQQQQQQQQEQVQEQEEKPKKGGDAEKTAGAGE